MTNNLMAYGTLFTALFTLLIAIFTYLSVRALYKTLLAQVVFHIREQFDPKEIIKSITILKSIEGEIN